MNDTLKHTKEDKHGLGKLEEIEPWDIAPLLICQRDGALVDVEHATDIEFDIWIKGQRIPVINGQWGGKWSFDDRCGVINHMRKFGVEPKFLEQNNSEIIQPPNFLPNYLEGDKSVLQADGKG